MLNAGNIDEAIDKYGKSIVKDVVRLRNILTDLHPYEDISMEDVKQALNEYQHPENCSIDISSLLAHQCSQCSEKGGKTSHINTSPIYINIDTSKPNKQFK